jgi:hypothetical protein
MANMVSGCHGYGFVVTTLLILADKLQFFTGIPSVEVTKGILHLYKLK